MGYADLNDGDLVRKLKTHKRMAAAAATELLHRTGQLPLDHVVQVDIIAVVPASDR